MRAHLMLVATGLVALAASVSACGSGDSNSDATPVKPDNTFTIQAKNVKFLPDKLAVQAGSVVELTLENLDATEHDLQVEELNAELMSGGSTRAEHGGGSGNMMVAVHTMANETGSVMFMANKKGTYNFYCTISGHKEAGMVGTLTVE